MNLELKFDEMTIDTSIAEDFIKEHSSFLGINYVTTEDVVYDNISNKIYLSGANLVIKNDEEPKPKLIRLVKLIEENEKLFCQLEYLIRHIPPAEVKNYDLHLIKQNLIYCVSSSTNDPCDDSRSPTINMYNDSPLARLGYIAQCMISTGRFHIVSQANTAAVCWLFADLCNKAGFEGSVCLEYIRSDARRHAIQQPVFDEYEPGCFGIIMAKSDIDSAVDTLIGAPKRLPWRVTRILVQEDVLQRFQSALEYKAKRDARFDVDEALSGKCSKVYICDTKVFFVNFAGVESELSGVSNAIIVEAFRTIKELTSLLQKLKLFCVSLWSESVSESNEIVHKIKSNIVWINCFGYFNGPPKSSQAFFRYEWGCDNKKWIELSVLDRVKRICNVLTLKPDENFIDNLEMYNHFSSSENVTCVVMQEKHGCRVVKLGDDKRSLLSCLALGVELLVPEEDKIKLPTDISYTLDVLEKEGLPVRSLKKNLCNLHFLSTRVIWTTFGTIFAN